MFPYRRVSRIQAIAAIVDKAGIKAGDTVLEIGPGTGPALRGCRPV